MDMFNIYLDFCRNDERVDRLYRLSNVMKRKMNNVYVCRLREKRKKEKKSED